MPPTKASTKIVTRRTPARDIPLLPVSFETTTLLDWTGFIESSLLVSVTSFGLMVGATTWPALEDDVVSTTVVVVLVVVVVVTGVVDTPGVGVVVVLTLVMTVVSGGVVGRVPTAYSQ